MTTCLANHSYANDNNKNALAKAQYMLRQVSSEKDKLKIELETVKKEKEKLEKELENSKINNKKTVAEIGLQQSQLESSSKRNESLLKNIEEEKTKLKNLHEENSNLLEKLTNQTENFQTCYQNNKKLYEINQEILGQYQDKGFWDALSQKEPLTSLGKVKVENLIQDYQYKMDGLEIKLVKESNELTN
jgi:chromosome segregation ATPase